MPRNKVFKGLASRGKSSLGWFFGFKLHLIVNEVGELLAFKESRQFHAQLNSWTHSLHLEGEETFH
ncbi:hypothetical protein CMK14_13670 [Candidatus Poribacteria bacterium]|nr:hypothetical protein [Candidatus Poribacteria bacterium]